MRTTAAIDDGGAPAVAGADCWAGAEKPRQSVVPRVLGLLMVVLAFVGLMQSLGGLRAAADFEAFLFLGDRVERWRTFGFWVSLTGLFVGGLHLAAGVWAVWGRRRAPVLAAVYAGVAILRVTFVVVLYYQTTAPVLRPFGKTELFGGHDVGLLIHAALLLGWAALVVLLMNLGGSRRACSG